MPIRKDIKDEYSYSVRDSKIHGKGVFPNEKIGKGKKSLGMVLTDQDILYSDLGRYINHSKSPNCKLIDDGSKNFLVVTLNDINDGEEMVVDYDTNPPEFGKSDMLDRDYFSDFGFEEVDDNRMKYRYFIKLNENIKRIKRLLF